MSANNGKKHKKKEVEIDFNDPNSFKSIVNEIAKDKSKNGGKNIATRVVTFVTTNIKATAIVLIYLTISGIIANVSLICNLIKSFF